MEQYLRSRFASTSMLSKKLVFLKFLNPNSSLPLQAKYAPAHDGISEDGQLLCDTVFSLAYGALLLLSHTTLKLYRGRRYGILGPNGSGKSTLMRQLREGKVESFPPQDELRCVMVEHALQGEDTSLSIIDFIASGELLRLRTII
jgi:elongation factor 3